MRAGGLFQVVVDYAYLPIGYPFSFWWKIFKRFEKGKDLEARASLEVKVLCPTVGQRLDQDWAKSGGPLAS